MSFKHFLLEFINVDASKLTNTSEFKKFEAVDPDFAKKMVNAWKGDSSDFARDKDKFDGLFNKMLSNESIKRFSPKSLHLKSEALKLVQLHNFLFPTKNKKFTGNKWENQDYSTHKRGNN